MGALDLGRFPGVADVGVPSSRKCCFLRGSFESPFPEVANIEMPCARVHNFPGSILQCLALCSPCYLV